jgi:DNA-binding MarR family transcriptional regulator
MSANPVVPQLFAICNEWAKDPSVTERANAAGSSEKLRTREIDEVLAACRLLVAISVGSLGAVADQVTLVQLRILTVVSSRPGIGVRELAAATGLHVSRASRACDRMVDGGWLAREEDPRDRRGVRLSVTAAGRSLVNRVATARRKAIRPALQRMTAEQRTELVDALTTFAGSADRPADIDLWAAGWTT